MDHRQVKAGTRRSMGGHPPDDSRARLDRARSVPCHVGLGLARQHPTVLGGHCARPGRRVRLAVARSVETDADSRRVGAAALVQRPSGTRRWHWRSDQLHRDDRHPQFRRRDCDASRAGTQRIHGARSERHSLSCASGRRLPRAVHDSAANGGARGRRLPGRNRTG